MTVLRATDVAVSFGGVHALTGVDLSVGEGQLVGLIGPNGAGKTTFIDALTGFVPCRGSLELDGRNLAPLPPHRRARRGLARTWQRADLFDDLTVRENLAVAAMRPSAWAMARETVSRSLTGTAGMDRAVTLLGLDARLDVLASELQQGERRLVGIGRALAAEPKLICLDEPAAGLDHEESASLRQHLRAIVDTGIAVLLVDHDMGLVLDVCDEVVVLDFGRVIAHGLPGAIREHPEVISAYLGRGHGSRTGEAS